VKPPLRVLSRSQAQFQCSHRPVAMQERWRVAPFRNLNTTASQGTRPQSFSRSAALHPLARRSGACCARSAAVALVVFFARTGEIGGRAVRPSSPRPSPGAVLGDKNHKAFPDWTTRTRRRRPRALPDGEPLGVRSRRSGRTCCRHAVSPVLEPSARRLSSLLGVLASASTVLGRRLGRNLHNGHARLSLSRSGGCNGGRTSSWA
jgi:hypothetical protein